MDQSELSQLCARRDYTKDKIKLLQNRLKNAEKRLEGKACVYATGSFGRLEASEKSDLDLFIVGKAIDSVESNINIRKSQLSRLDDICIKADLIEETRALKLPEFDGDGKYLVHYSVDDFTRSLGQPDDDANNTLTGRLLLFLESQPLLGKAVYSEIIEDVIATYWRDYEDHKNNFVPAFLANDILRLWRTFCVNYEAKTERTPDEKKIKGKVKNYKLKHSRMLTCYSALLYLLAKHVQNSTVSINDALDMTRLTPTHRLEWLVKETQDLEVRSKIEALLGQYERFLKNTSQGDSALIETFSDPRKGSEFINESYRFGDLMFEALRAVGKDSKLLRLMVV